MNANEKTNATKKTGPLDHPGNAAIAAQLLAQRYRTMADEIAEAGQDCELGRLSTKGIMGGRGTQVDALVQAIVNITRTTNGVVIDQLEAAYEGGGR